MLALANPLPFVTQSAKRRAETIASTSSSGYGESGRGPLSQPLLVRQDWRK